MKTKREQIQLMIAQAAPFKIFKFWNDADLDGLREKFFHWHNRRCLKRELRLLKIIIIGFANRKKRKDFEEYLDYLIEDYAKRVK